jgi:hypothetical protein
MYQGPDVTQNITTAEEVLIGKSLKEKSEEKKHFSPVFQESYSNPNNEVFTKIHEDPLYVIKREENRQRKEIEENPYKMKMLLKQVETELLSKKEKKKHKKDKKEKKEKKKDKNSRRSPSSSPEAKITTPSFAQYKSSQSTPQVYGLVDGFGNKINLKNNNLGPREEIYKDKIALKEEEDRLRYKSSSSSYKHLSESEKEKLREEMENRARGLDEYKQQNKSREKSASKEGQNSYNNIQPNFINKVGKEAYSGDFDLSEQLRRKGHKYK